MESNYYPISDNIIELIELSKIFRLALLISIACKSYSHHIYNFYRLNIRGQKIKFDLCGFKRIKYLSLRNNTTYIHADLVPYLHNMYSLQKLFIERASPVHHNYNQIDFTKLSNLTCLKIIDKLEDIFQHKYFKHDKIKILYLVP